MILDILLSVFKFCQAIYIFKYKPCWSNFINKTQKFLKHPVIWI